jgi:N utilization substance protein B
MSREYAVQMMYQLCMTDGTPEEVLYTFWKSFDKPANDITEFAEKLFTNAVANKDEHERLVAQFLKDTWTLDRLGEMEKCIFRVAVDELLNGDVPAYAIMDEYVTLASRFTDDKTASFVNGMLENIRNEFCVKE